MATTVEIQGNFDRQDGNSSVSGVLKFTLTKRDYDGLALIEPSTQTVSLDANGEFDGLLLWPNSRGVEGSGYRVEYTPEGGKTEELSKSLFVPETGGPHHLTWLLKAEQVAAAARIGKVIPTTLADYNARAANGSLVDALYLIEG